MRYSSFVKGKNRNIPLFGAFDSFNEISSKSISKLTELMEKRGCKRSSLLIEEFDEIINDNGEIDYTPSKIVAEITIDISNKGKESK